MADPAGRYLKIFPKPSEVRKIPRKRKEVMSVAASDALLPPANASYSMTQAFGPVPPT